MNNHQFIYDFKEDPYANNCDLELQYVAGSFFDSSPERSGLAHLTEHLFLDREENKRLKDNGVYYNAYTNSELMGLTFSGPYTTKYEYGISSAFTTIERILEGKERLINEEDLTREKNIILNELHQITNDANKFIFNEYNKIIYKKGNPYRQISDLGTAVIGSTESINSIAVADVNGFINKNISNNSCIVKLYYEGSRSNFEALLDRIQSLIAAVSKSSLVSNMYPYDKLDLLEQDTDRKIIKIDSVSEKNVRVLNLYTYVGLREESPEANILRYIWKNALNTSIYYLTRKLGVGYRSKTGVTQLSLKQLHNIEYSLNDSSQADDLIVKTNEEIDIYISQNMDSFIENALRMYNIECDIHPINPSSELNSRVKQFRKYGKELHTLQQLRDETLSLDKEYVKGLFTQLFKNKLRTIKVEIGSNPIT